MNYRDRELNIDNHSSVMKSVIFNISLKYFKKGESFKFEIFYTHNPNHTSNSRYEPKTTL